MRKLFVMGLLVLVLFSYVSAQFGVDEFSVALWHFDEGKGNTFVDETGNGNDGVIEGAIWTKGRFGGALMFDGVDDRIVITKTPSVDVTEQVTLEAYVKRGSSEDGTIVSKNGPYFLGIRSNVVAGAVYTNDGVGANTWTEVHGTTILEQEVWYKLKMIYDGLNVRVYVNEILENSAPKIGQMPQVSQGVFIGWGEPGQNQFFNGVIDEVRISNIARVFIRGDANNDEIIDIGDAIFTLSYLFRGGERPFCLDAADTNDDGVIDVSDAVYTLLYLFRGGAEPPEPFTEAGSDITQDNLEC